MQYRNLISFIIVSLLALTISATDACAQKRNLSSGSFTAAGVPGSANAHSDSSQEFQNQEEVPVTKPSFTIPMYFRSLAHKDTMQIQHMFAGSVILPGSAQIYNRQTWKLPIVYGTIGGFVGGAVAFNASYKSTGKESAKNWRNAMIAGAALSYYCSILDGIISFKSEENPLPARASLYSAILPGLGQAYNGDYWKIPIFYGGLAVSGYCWAFNQKQFKRYKQMYIDASAEGSSYNGQLSPENMIWYRDKFRRFRDYSIIATVLVYALNIIDANVFAHFNNFDISDDITVDLAPGLIETTANSPINNYYQGQAVGLKMNLKF